MPVRAHGEIRLKRPLSNGRSPLRSPITTDDDDDDDDGVLGAWLDDSTPDDEKATSRARRELPAFARAPSAIEAAAGAQVSGPRRQLPDDCS